MTSFKNRIVTLFFTLAPILVLSAGTYKTSKITGVDGLSNSAISSITKDSHDRLWIGTWDGLNIYDGHSIRVLKPQKQDEKSLPSNVIFDIIEARGGAMWVSTLEGVGRVNPSDFTVKRYLDRKSESAAKLNGLYRFALACDQRLCCLVRFSELTYYHAPSDSFCRIELPMVDSLQMTAVKSDDVGRLYLLTTAGRLYRIDLAFDQEQRACVKACVQILGEQRFQGLLTKDATHFWLIGKDNYIYEYDTHEKRLVRLFHTGQQIARLGITSMSEFDGHIIIGTYTGGLFLFDPLTERFALHEGADYQGGVLCMYKDPAQQIIWLGTNGNGVTMTYLEHLDFDYISRRDLYRSKRNAGAIRAVCQDADGRIWLGNRGGGVAVINNLHDATPRIRSLTTIEDEPILAIARGDAHSVLIGSEFGNLYRCDTRNLSLSEVKIPIAERIDLEDTPPVYGLYWDSQRSTVWVGTNNIGIIAVRLDTLASPVRPLDYTYYDKHCGLTSGSIYSLVPIDSRLLCVATRGGGLNVLDRESGRVVQTLTEHSDNSGLSDNDVICVIKSRDGALWAGTSYGVNRVTLRGDEPPVVKQFTEQNGLKNNSIHGIVEDDNGMIWVSTTGGVSRINPTNDAVTNYYHGYGLQNNEFTDGAYAATASGEVIFGGSDGINHFFPTQLENRDFTPRINISSLKINNREIDPKRFSGEDFSRLTLGHHENFFEVSFVAMDYINNANCEYRYILEGFNQDWVDLGTKHTATFTNVPPGSYTLRVAASNGDKIWNGAALDLQIKIRQPWWFTGYAFLLYLLFAAAMFYAAYRTIKRRIVLNRAVFVERTEKQQLAAAYEEKLRFFTNISHEFRTPLTLIGVHLESLMPTDGTSVAADDAKRHIGGIHRNTIRMQRLIGELLDFRKQELGYVKLNVREQDLFIGLRNVCDAFTDYARSRNIRLVLEIPPKGQQVWVDAEQMQKVWFNLISNAFKYTPDAGFVTISVDCETDRVAVSVADNGVGIAPEHIDRIFDNFYQVNDGSQPNTGTGIGLALTKAIVEEHGGDIIVRSTIGVGSVFTVTLRTGYEHLLNLPHIRLSDAQPLQATLTTKAAALEATSSIDTTKSSQPTDSLVDKRPVVLLVEDETELLEMMEQIFSQYYRVLTADNGQRGLQIAMTQYPDLIVSDVVMPQLSGYDMCARLKSEIGTCHIPVVLVTAQTSEEHNITGFECGADAYITKPFSVRLLLSRCESILRNRRIIQEKFQSGIQEAPETLASNDLDRKFIETLIALIETNISDPKLNITKLCSGLAIGRSVLFSKMKSMTGKSPMDFIQNIRLKRAAVLLRSGLMTISEISDRMGFTSINYFDKCFKEQFGVTPTEYRTASGDGGSDGSGSEPQ